MRWWMGAAVAALTASLAAASPSETIAAGKALFERTWTIGKADPIAGGDGLGPLYNDVSCVACHALGGVGGAGPMDKNTQLLIEGDTASQLHRFGVGRAAGDRDARVLNADGGTVTFHEVFVDPDGTEQILFEDVLSDPTILERNTPALWGIGLLDTVPRAALIEAAAVQARAGGKVKGRLGVTADKNVGRFGWKNDVTSAEAFVNQACATELGLSTPGHPQALPADAKPQRGATDLDEAHVGQLVAFIRSLPRPEREPATPTTTRGEEVFAEIGCADCHLTELGGVTGAYTDLLLHDMGPELSDGAQAGTYGRVRAIKDPRLAASWRTPPLWGVADSGPWLHDGRADSLIAAIRLHGGEGTSARRQFDRLQSADQIALVRFLGSLRAPGRTGRPPAWQAEVELTPQPSDPPEDRP